MHHHSWALFVLIMLCSRVSSLVLSIVVVFVSLLVDWLHLNHVDAVCFFCYMAGSTFLGHAVQFFACEPRVLFHCFVRSSVHDDAVGDHSIKEFCCITFVRFFHPEVHLHFARSGICVISN